MHLLQGKRCGAHITLFKGGSNSINSYNRETHSYGENSAIAASRCTTETKAAATFKDPALISDSKPCSKIGNNLRVQTAFAVEYEILLAQSLPKRTLG